MSEQRALPEGARLLHVGPPKTGSTALQDAFHQSRVSLGRQGVTYVSRGRHEVIPARYITGRVPGGPKWAWAEKRWSDLVAAMTAEGPARKVYSSEYLADASDDQVAQIVDAFGVEDTYVVITLRPLIDVVPSQYQQYLQGGLTLDYESWLEVTYNEPPFTGPTPWFWQRHRHDALVQRWVRALGPERVIVVVTDGTDLDAVPSAFEQLLGLSRGTLVGRQVQPNRSLTWAEAEVMRRFNVQAHDAGLVDSKYQFLTKYAAEHVKERTPSPLEARIVTPDWAAKRADELGAQFAAVIEECGVRVFGDLQRLAPGTGLSGWSGPPESVDLDVATRFAAGFVLAERQVRDQVASRRGNRRSLKPPTGSGRGSSTGRDLAPGRTTRIRRATEQLAARLANRPTPTKLRSTVAPVNLTVQRSAASVIE